MGQECGAICSKCGAKFRVADGCGESFYMLHCEECGKAKAVNFSELEKVRKKQGRKFTPSEVAAFCECGGQFSSEAKPRCPKCKSIVFKRDPGSENNMYD